MPGTTPRAVEIAKERASEVNFRYLDSIFSFFEYLDGFLNAYTVHGRENQLDEIVIPVLEDVGRDFAREMSDIIKEKYPKWYRRSWFDFLREFFYALYFYRHRPSSAIILACDRAGVTVGTARLVFYYLYRSGVEWAYEYYRVADELRRIDEYNLLRVVRAVGTALDVAGRRTRVEDRKIAYDRCVRNCLRYFIRMFQRGKLRRRVKSIQEVMRAYVEYCKNICMERVQ